MDLPTIIWSLRIGVGLSIGIYVANYWKEGLRGIVIRCIPVKHRISERSYILQTRITTVVGMLFALLIAIGLNVLFSISLQRLGWQTPSQQQSVTPKILPIPPRPVRPSVQELPTPVQPAEVSEPPQVVPTPAKEPPTLPTVSHTPMTRRKTTPEKIYAPATRKRYQPIAVPCYLQLNAFHTIAKAENQKARWSRQTPYPVKIGFVAMDVAPYKVLLGPFPSRQVAQQFQGRLTVASFIRPAEGLQFLTR